VRSFAYLDVRDAGLLGLDGVADAVQVVPTPGASPGDVKRAMFGLPGVASVQPVSAIAQVLRDLIDQMEGILTVIEFFVLALALLVAFNAASINVDERAREHATMFAFGMRLRMTGIESLIVELLGTLIGLGLGVAALGALMESATTESPQIGMLTRLAPATVLAALVFGALAGLLAPLLTARKLKRMDVPSTLRVME
jgi:putative ABC transport system permease protein